MVTTPLNRLKQEQASTAEILHATANNDYDAHRLKSFEKFC